MSEYKRTLSTATELTEADRTNLRNIGPRSFSDSPSSSGLSPAEIKSKLEKQPLLLFHYIQQLISELNTISEEASGNDAYLKELSDELSSALTAYKALVESTYAKIADHQATQARVTTLESKTSALETEEATHIHAKVDENGNVYADYSNVDSSVSDGTNKLPTREDADSIVSGIKAVNESVGAMLAVESNNSKNIEKMLDGTESVGKSLNAEKATADKNGNVINALKYITDIEFSYDASSGTITAKGLNQSGTTLITKTLDLPAELIFDDQGYDSETKKLWFHPVGNKKGSNVEIDVSDLFDVYTGGDTEAISVSVENNVVKATLLDGSVSYDKLDSDFQSVWDSWVSAESARVTAENARVQAEASRVQAEAQRQLNETARENNYKLFVDSEGYTCCEYDNLKVVSQ